MERDSKESKRKRRETETEGKKERAKDQRELVQGSKVMMPNPCIYKLHHRVWPEGATTDTVNTTLTGTAESDVTSGTAHLRHA
jgi:hypothetical protein